MLAAPAVASAAGDLAISQVYGGGGNAGAPYTNDFVEIFNRGTSTISLNGYSLQYASATGTGTFGSNPVVSLVGNLAPGQYYLVQLGAGATASAALPTPDLTGTTNMGGTAGKVALVSTTVGLGCNGGSSPCTAGQVSQILDLVGYGTANFFEGTAAPAASNTTSLFRAATGCTDTDSNGNDFTASAPAPRNTTTPLAPCVAPDAAPAVASTSPANGDGAVAATTNLTVAFSEPVNLGASPFSLVCSSGSRTLGVTGGPTTFTLDPTTDLANGDSCTLTVTAAAVTDQDANDPPDAMAADVTATFSVVDVCTQPFTAVPSIQGSGPSAAITGNVTTQGVVVADLEGTAAGSGFYLQDVLGDGNPATSDGIFVFTGSASLVTAGQIVRVTGFARERFNQTVINGSNSNAAVVPAANVVACGTGSVSPVDVMLPVTAADFLERYEGMLTRFPQPLVIAEYFNYDRFGEIVLARPLTGETRPFTGTAIDEPGLAANGRTLANSLSRITLDDNRSAQNPAVLRHPNGDPFSLSNRFRGGDTVQNAVGVLGFDFSLYRIFPTGPADYTATNPRPAAPEAVDGTVRVAAMNTLNFFVTGDYPTGNPLDNKCGPLQNVECRGWDADQPTELTRQRDKLVAALQGLNGDVVGLNELENTTGVDPLTAATGVLGALNAAVGAGTYSAIDTGVIGTDAIRVGLIYKPAVVTPVGPFKLLTTAVDPRFIDTKSRPALAQTFTVNTSGARFTVVVNHLKSKGSDCNDVGDPDLLDGQGNCSQTRRAAAEALVDWLATDPTGSGDPDFLIVGDLNSYTQEQTIDEILAGSDDVAGTSDDFTNLIADFQGTYAYSYTFDGQAGYLDHALASSSAAAQVTGAADWHINSDEPDVLDYDTSFKPNEQDVLYEPNASRSSDHDPVVVGLTPTAATSLAVTGTFYDADANATTSLVAQLASPGGCSTGKDVTFSVDANGLAGDGYELLVGTAETDTAGVARITWTFDDFGIYDVLAVFEGTPECLPSSATGTVAIVSPGDAANGGGWYQQQTTGSPRVNFGFTVKRQSDGGYRGQLLWSNNGKWRIKGTLTSFGKVDPCSYAGTAGLRCGSAEGTGTLYRWNAATLTWDAVQAVAYVISFVDGGSSKKGGAKPDSFGINVTSFASPSLPESAPQQLKGGNVLVG